MGKGAAVKKHSAHHLWIQQLVRRTKEFSREKRTLSLAGNSSRAVGTPKGGDLHGSNSSGAGG
jgi:hypothetical protein